MVAMPPKKRFRRYHLIWNVQISKGKHLLVNMDRERESFTRPKNRMQMVEQTNIQSKKSPIHHAVFEIKWDNRYWANV